MIHAILRRAPRACLILAVGIGAKLYADPGPGRYVRYAFTPDPTMRIDRRVTLDRLEVFVALNEVNAPHFLRSFARVHAPGGDVATADALELKYLKSEDYADIHRAAAGQLEFFANTIGQPAPLIRPPQFSPGARLAIAWVNTFERTARVLQRGGHVRFRSDEYTIAMHANAYHRPSDEFPIAVYVRRAEWDSENAGPLEVHQEVLTGRARREDLNAADLSLVADLLKLHHCQAALN